VASLRKRLRPRLLVVYVFALALIWSARPTAWSLALGVLPIVVGAVLRLWATGFLHKTESLTVSGPYAFLRHPLYTGTLLIGGGFAVMAATPAAYWLFIAFAVVFFVYYMPYKNRIEGARLEAAFGDEYRRYAAAVPRLVPRIHAYVPLGGVPTAVAQWRAVRFADNNELGTTGAAVAGALALVMRWSLL